MTQTRSQARPKPQFRKEMVENFSDWSRWIAPVRRGHRIACCDCGSVHELQFRVVLQDGTETDMGTWRYDPRPVRDARVIYRARKSVRATRDLRNKKRFTHK